MSSAPRNAGSEPTSGAEFVAVTGAEGKGIAIVSAEGVAVIGERPISLLSHRAALASYQLPPREMLPLTPTGPTTDLPWRELALADAEVTAVARHTDRRIAAGDRSGLVRVFGAAGDVLSEAKFESPILSLHLFGPDLLVGEDRGALSRLRSNGSVAWRIVTPYLPMPWPYWSEQKSRIREITSADINGDGADEILVSNADRRVYAFSADGKRLWKTPVEWGVYTAMTPGEYAGKFALLGGTSCPSIHGYCILFGADGRLLRYLSRPDIVSWSIPSQFCDMRLVDCEGADIHQENGNRLGTALETARRVWNCGGPRRALDLGEDLVEDVGLNGGKLPAAAVADVPVADRPPPVGPGYSPQVSERSGVAVQAQQCSE